MLPKYSKILKEEEGNEAHETLLPSEGFLVPIRPKLKCSLRALSFHALLVLLYTSIYVTIWHLHAKNGQLSNHHQPNQHEPTQYHSHDSAVDTNCKFPQLFLKRR
jgi:hypothetical protein